jgi:outer membrane protein
MRKLIYIGAISAAAFAGTPALAEAGDILVKARGTYHLRLDGLSVALPDSGQVDRAEGSLPGSGQVTNAEVADAAGAEASLTLFMTNNLALELALGATKYEVRDETGGALVSANLLMSTATVQYHLMPESKGFRPYLGVGVSHLNLYNDKVDIVLLNKAEDQFSSTNARLTGGFAPVGQVGADIAISERSYVNLDVKYTARKTEILIERGSSSITERRLGALVLGVGMGFKF